MSEGLSARVAELELALAAQTRRSADSEREVAQLRQIGQKQREANQKLRQVVEAKDSLLAEQARAVEGLRLEVADLRRRLERSSQNSSQPPSKDRPDQKKPKPKSGASGQQGRKRKRGGQPGRPGSGLVRAKGSELDQTRTAERPADCRGCGADLAQGVPEGTDWTQVFDIPAVRLRKVEWRLPRIRCGCGCLNRGAAPVGGPGQVVYGPNVAAAAIVLNHFGTLPVERTSQVMGMLLDSPVSTGYVCTVTDRLADRLDQAGFAEAVKAALARQAVLTADETPVNVASKSTTGSPHIFGVGTPDGKLRLLQELGSRSKASIAETVLGVFTGTLVRDDYAAYSFLDNQLAGVQLCGAHLLREARGVLDLDPATQAWAGHITQILREARTAVQDAKTAGHTRLDPDLLTQLRQRYDHHVTIGININTDRSWGGRSARHPGYNLARRLRDKADQIWLFAHQFDVPFTNNSSEQRLRISKVRQGISGCWQTMRTLNTWCTTRTYLDNARNHGHTVLEAIHNALTGNPWLPELT